MQKFSRIAGLSIVLLAIQLACGTAVPASPTEPDYTPTPSATPTATPIPGPEGQIAYGSSTYDGISEVVLMDLESGNETSLTAGFDGEYNRPVWSPDGRRLAMREDITMDGGGIAIMDVGLEGGRPIGSIPVELFHGFADSPTWSPDGSRVAFVSTRETGSWTAYTVDLLGSAPVRIPGIPQHATDLAWSPDGAWIAFAYYDNPSEQIKDIYIIHPDGTGLTRLTSTPDADEDGPAWSPDSRQIAFSGRDRTGTVGERSIYRMNADGSGVTRVTIDPAGEFDPAWSPDGTQIAFTSTRDEVHDGNYEIYIIDADGTDELRLTNNLSTDRWPTWRTTPAGTSYAGCRAGAQFTADVTIPEGTRFAGPQEFSKVWRIQNSGTCAWAPVGYGLRFAGGEQMGGTSYLPLPGAIQPGETIDLALALSAPATPGWHSGTWGVYDNTGRRVPGPDGGTLTLSVNIEVMNPSSTTLPSPLYFLSSRSGSRQIWRMETDGVTVTQITREAAGVDSYDVCPTDGSVAYIVSGSQLLFIQRDGTGRRVLVDFGSKQGGNPGWSPDGKLLAYALDGIRVYDPATGKDRLVRANGSTESVMGIANYYPLSWSPDGTKILASVGYYEGADLAILSVTNGKVLGHAPWTDMYAWSNDSQAVFLASSFYPMMFGMEPGLQLIPAAGDSIPLIQNAFVWWPFHRPDNQLVYFVSRPAGEAVTEYNVRISASAADGSGERALRSRPLALDIRDSFDALWAADGTAVVVRILRPASDSREVLLVPANDNPAVFLMMEGSDLQWGS